MTRKIRITLETNGNAAFDYPTVEVVRILRDTAIRLEQENHPEDGFYLKDVNGNTCGRVDIDEEDDE